MIKDKKGYKIAFVNLKNPLPIMSVNTRFTYEQVGIGYLTAVLRHIGYDVKIVDAQTKNLDKNEDRPKNSKLDKIPFPARDSLEWQINNGGSSTARVITSRGCAYNCSFCSTPAFERIQQGPLWCARCAENVLDELKYLKEKFDITTVLFSDDNFTGPGNYGRKRVEEILNGN
jgi:radical SAM superfamily enzyme YgiQ (UPF0313 family)